MPRGGKRSGAGSKPKWNHGKTKTVRVPIELVDQILEIARGLDQGLSYVTKEEAEHIASSDYDTESKTLNLSGISVNSIRNRKFVFLDDLLRSGYEIKPLRLANVVRQALLKT